MPLPALIREAAAALGIEPTALRPTSGASGLTWDLGEAILRVGPRERIRVELAAREAAAAALPVPAVWQQADLGEYSALLEERMPGSTAISSALVGDLTIERAARRGRACGRVHHRLEGVRAPTAVPAVAGSTGTHAGLLHLDLHPFNVLLDENDEVSAVIDWANAATGHVHLDRARTFAIFAADPTGLRFAGSAVGRAFASAWAETAGFAEVPPDARAWGLRYLIDDLKERVPPKDLRRARRLLARIEAQRPTAAAARPADLD